MTIPYQQAFSRYYDLLYSDKPYAAECDLLESIFAKYAARPRTLLDAGCGSGSHATELAARGYRVVGVDRSPCLLEIARGKARARNLDIDYQRADLRSVQPVIHADACVSLFAVLNFQLTNEDVQSVLTRIRASLDRGGLFVCDVWNGAAVLAQGLQPRHKTVSRDGVTVTRTATPAHCAATQIVDLTQELVVTGPDDRHETVVEVQTIRYMVPQELSFHLETAGFEVLELFPFPRLGAGLSEMDWDLGAIARAR